jgi:transposase
MARRRWTAEEKAGIVLESLAPGVNLAELCRSHQVSASQVYGWWEKFLAGGKAALANGQPPDRAIKKSHPQVRQSASGSVRAPHASHCSTRSPSSRPHSGLVQRQNGTSPRRKRWARGLSRRGCFSGRQGPNSRAASIPRSSRSRFVPSLPGSRESRSTIWSTDSGSLSHGLSTQGNGVRDHSCSRVAAWSCTVPARSLASRKTASLSSGLS